MFETRTVVNSGRWAAATMFFVNGFVAGSWAPQVPSFVTRLGISEFTLGLLILGYGLAALWTMTLAGQLVARIGSGKTLRLFVVPVIFMLPLAAQASNVWLGGVVLILFGAAIGGMDVAMNANVVAVEKQLGRAIMSTSHGFWSLGGFTGGSLGGIAIQAFGPVEHAILVAILSAVVVAFCYSNIADGAPPPLKDGLKHFVWPRQAGIYAIGAMALLCMCAEGSVLNWSALYLQKELFADTAIVGFAFAGFSGVMALTRFCGDGIRNHFGAVMTFRCSCLIAALSMLVAGLSPWPWLAIAAFAVCGIGAANLVPILFSTAGNQPGLNSGVSMSVVTTIGHVGLLLAPSIIGFAAGKVGLASVYVAMAFLLAAISLMAAKTAAADTKSS
ncbi:membrane protein [Pseudorhizobium pelagicum]|nr:membrane protein [Pseudorhizobium pelagicum]